MNTRKLRDISFYLHRWLGLVAGILLCIAGLTGSILVFWREIDRTGDLDNIFVLPNYFRTDAAIFYNRDRLI
jgi:uncharacterized iron-regulated membrane protein